MTHVLASTGVTGQVGAFTSFLHGISAAVIYLIALGLFLVLAKSERLGGLSFRHVFIALAFGALGAVAFLPAQLQADLSVLANPAKRLTADAIFGAIILFEIIMIIRDRRAGGEE